MSWNSLSSCVILMKMGIQTHLLPTQVGIQAIEHYGSYCRHPADATDLSRDDSRRFVERRKTVTSDFQINGKCSLNCHTEWSTKIWVYKNHRTDRFRCVSLYQFRIGEEPTPFSSSSYSISNSQNYVCYPSVPNNEER